MPAKMGHIPLPVEQMEKTVARLGVGIRIEAGLAYMTLPGAMSVDTILADPKFSKIQRRTMEQWCSEDKWVQRRKKFFEKWTYIAQQRIGSQLARSKMEEYKRLQQMQALAEEHLHTTKPKSWEGVARVRLEVGRRMEEIAGAVLEEIVPKETDQSPQVVAIQETELTEEERQTVATQILSMRRNANRAKLGSGLAEQFGQDSLSGQAGAGGRSGGDLNLDQFPRTDDGLGGGAPDVPGGVGVGVVDRDLKPYDGRTIDADIDVSVASGAGDSDVDEEALEQVILVGDEPTEDRDSDGLLEDIEVP